MIADTIRKHVAHWQDILRLRDWDIELEMAPAGWRKSGDVKIDLDDKKAVLIINERPRTENLEELVVHELIHVRLWAMDQMLVELLDAVYGTDEDDPRRAFAYGRFFMVLESTTEDLTKALLAAAGRGDALSFGRLRGQIEGEIGPGRCGNGNPRPEGGQ